MGLDPNPNWNETDLGRNIRNQTLTLSFGSRIQRPGSRSVASENLSSLSEGSTAWGPKSTTRRCLHGNHTFPVPGPQRRCLGGGKGVSVVMEELQKRPFNSATPDRKQVGGGGQVQEGQSHPVRREELSWRTGRA